MSDRPDILAQIRRMAATLLGLKPGGLEGRTLEHAGADGEDLAMLALEIEAEFSVVITDMELPGLRTCEDFARLGERKLGASHG